MCIYANFMIIQTLKPFVLSPFEVVVDCTQFSAENEWSPEWVARLEKLIPYESSASLTALFIYNANTALRKFTKKYPRYHSKLGKRVFFLSSLTEFADHIHDLRLPKSTGNFAWEDGFVSESSLSLFLKLVALEKEVITTLAPVNKVISYRHQMPVVIKVNQEFIQIATVRLVLLRAKFTSFYDTVCLNRPRNRRY